VEKLDRLVQPISTIANGERQKIATDLILGGRCSRVGCISRDAAEKFIPLGARFRMYVHVGFQKPRIVVSEFIATDTAIRAITYTACSAVFARLPPFDRSGSSFDNLSIKQPGVKLWLFHKAGFFKPNSSSLRINPQSGDQMRPPVEELAPSMPGGNFGKSLPLWMRAGVIGSGSS
jgi:hypothetical protein